MKRIFPLLVLSLLPCALSAQFPIAWVKPALMARPSYDIKTDTWSAFWISTPGNNRDNYGVYCFRKEVTLAKVPAQYIIHVSGDDRYKLYVNGTLVSAGPARSDDAHWNYETIDLAPWLQAGSNVVAAQTWDGGKDRPVSVYSVRSGFLLLGEGEASVLNTDESWLTIQDQSYSPMAVRVPGYYAAGPSEAIDMSRHINDFAAPDCDTSRWQHAELAALANPHDVAGNFGTANGPKLVEGTLPLRELTGQRFLAVRRDGGLKIAKGWPEQKADITIPKSTQCDLLLDQGALTNAYMHLLMQGGKGASVKVTYAESLYEDPQGRGKGNRNDVEGKYLIGRADSLSLNGGSEEFHSLDWRTFRYVNLHVETRQEALTINDIYSTFTGYPFELRARLDTQDEELQKMLQVGWRTARLCAVETYMDCPYYEQLQYLGDTRIQALITLYNSGDLRMVRNFLRQADWSRTSEGVAQGRYPSWFNQFITPYALSYLYGVHDYMMYADDAAFVEELLPGLDQILGYFAKYQLADGRVSHLPGWNFSDWVDGRPEWEQGTLRAGKDGCSILMDMQLLYGYELAADMHRQIWQNEWQTQRYEQKAEQLKAAIRRNYWNAGRGLFADQVEQTSYSQHANAWAILTGMVSGDEARAIGQKLLSEKDLAPCSVYYKYYLHEALAKAGLGDDFLNWLGIWRENLRQGLTTWGETSDVNGTRSDCHAWGASLNIEFFRTLLGIDSQSRGFRTVRIAPHLGTLQHIGGTMPHPAGSITVAYKRQGKSGLHADITLPEGITGVFIWEGKTQQLHGGKNSLDL